MHFVDAVRAVVFNNVSRFVEGAEKDRDGFVKYYETARLLLEVKQNANEIKIESAEKKYAKAKAAYDSTLARENAGAPAGIQPARSQLLANFLFRVNPGSKNCKAAEAYVEKLKGKYDKCNDYAVRLGNAYEKFERSKVKTEGDVVSRTPSSHSSSAGSERRSTGGYDTTGPSDAVVKRSDAVAVDIDWNGREFQI